MFANEVNNGTAREEHIAIAMSWFSFIRYKAHCVPIGILSRTQKPKSTDVLMSCRKTQLSMSYVLIS